MLKVVQEREGSPAASPIVEETQPFLFLENVLLKGADSLSMGRTLAISGLLYNPVNITFKNQNKQSFTLH